MRTILILTGRYLPGWRDGGPVRSVLNLTEWMGDEYDIRIMCLDRDHGDTQPYPRINCGGFCRVGKANVWYTPAFTETGIEKLSKDADVVYVCGPYSDYARIAMRLKKSRKIAAPLYVASMGSFSPEAFRIKGFKKKLFIGYMKLSGMFDRVIWSVTSEREEEELKAVIGSGSRCVIASDLPRKGTTEHTGFKESGVLSVCFLSRISRKKNLIAVPDILRRLGGKLSVKLDIYGTCEDERYLRECIQKFKDLQKDVPDMIWEYKGEIDSEKVPSVFASYDAFLFPTLGENYGHVISESLAAACIPVISDTTPWLDLDENGCGYVCPLNDTAAFARALEELGSMTEEEISEKRAKCYEYIRSINAASIDASGYRTIFG